ncbi:hypothetical protein SLE2022_217390 [Rubroshorea leprosula]
MMSNMKVSAMDIRENKLVLQGDLLTLKQQGYDLVLIHLVPEKGRAACINITSRTSQKGWIRGFLKKLRKYCAAMEVIMGTDPENDLLNLISYACYHGNQLPTTASLLAVYKGKDDIFKRPRVYNLRGFGLNSRSESFVGENIARLKDAEVEEAEFPVDKTAKGETRGGNECLEDVSSYSSNHDKKATFSRSISVIRGELQETNLGWPLLRRKTRTSQEETSEIRSTSVVECVMNLPGKFAPETRTAFEVDVNGFLVKHCNTGGPNLQAIDEYEEELNASSRYLKDVNCDLDCGDKMELSSTTVLPGWPLLFFTGSKTLDSFLEDEAMRIPAKGKLQRHLELFSKLSSSGCKLFSSEELRRATSEFSSDNLIGEGGCSNVYKGCLPSGKLVAVKILKSYMEAMYDFSLEVDILLSLKHKNITTLLGVCIEDDQLISVYEFFPKGSLEENLHGNGEKSVLPWGVRFNVAITIAEALNYLHNESPQPVIHRDVKSSNILLSDDYQPQLSDFGLAIWMPKDSSYLIDSSVLGTFGYIAPEYLMQGRVSDKLDMFSFGIVLLELISGKRPVSIVQWAKPLIERGNLKELLDAKLDGDLDIVQMHRMLLAASFCISQSPQYRPKASQVLELLRGEKETREWYSAYVTDLQESGDHEDHLYNCSHQLPPVPLVFSSENVKQTMTLPCGIPTTSTTDAKLNQRLKFGDYLKEQLV